MWPILSAQRIHKFLLLCTFPRCKLKKCTGLRDQTDLRSVQPACLWLYKYSWQIQSPPTSSFWPVQSYFSASSIYILLVSTLYTHDCAPRHQKNSIVKYAENTSIISHIINNDDIHINNLRGWCTENNLPLSVSKTKELLVFVSFFLKSTHLHVTSLELRWSRWTVIDFLVLPSLRTHLGHHTPQPWIKNHRKCCTYYGHKKRLNSRVRFWSTFNMTWL